MSLAEQVAALEASVIMHLEEIDSLKSQLYTVTKDRDDWKHDFNMYRNAWLREIGGVIRNKGHEIDGFVLRTRDIYQGYEKWERHVAQEALKTHGQKPEGVSQPPAVLIPKAGE